METVPELLTVIYLSFTFNFDIIPANIRSWNYSVV